MPADARTVLLCRYRGAGPSASAGKLAFDRKVTSSKIVRRIAKLANELPTAGDGTTSCSVDDGSVVVAYFRYPDSGPAEAVAVHLGGCGQATNGARHVFGVTPAGAKLRDQIKGLTHCKPGFGGGCRN